VSEIPYYIICCYTHSVRQQRRRWNVRRPSTCLGRVRRQRRRRADSCSVGSRYDGGDGDGRPGNRLWPSPEHDDGTGKNRPEYGYFKTTVTTTTTTLTQRRQRRDGRVPDTGPQTRVLRSLQYYNTLHDTVCQRLTHHRRHTKMRSRASSSSPLRRDDNNNNNDDDIFQANFRFSRVIAVVAAVVKIAGTHHRPPVTGGTYYDNIIMI